MRRSYYFNRFALTISLLIGLHACGPSEPAADSPAPEANSVSSEANSVSSNGQSDVQSNVSESPTQAEPVETAAPSQASDSQPAYAGVQTDLEQCLDEFAYDPDDRIVNLRNQPEGDLITALPNLTIIRRSEPTGETQQWLAYAVPETGDRGFIFSDLVYPSHYRVQDPDHTTANIRTAPNGDLMLSLLNGTVVQFDGVENDWTRVITERGERGYITTSRLQPLECS